MASTAAVQGETLLNRNLEIVRSGVLDSPAGVSGTITQLSIFHNLGYLPILIAYVYVGTTSFPLPANLSSSVSSSYIQDFSRIEAAVSPNTLGISVYCATGTTLPSYKVRYYLLADTAR